MSTLHEDSLVVDTHVHAPGFVPQPFRALYRFVNRSTMPADVGFDVLAAAGVDAVVGKAVGDPVVTRWYRGGAWKAVLTQLDQVVDEAERAGADVVRDAAALRTTTGAGRVAVILGVEGLDCIGNDLDNLDELHRQGVRVVVPVHLGDNQIGSTSLPWQRYVGPLPVRRQSAGLTPFGRGVIRRCDDLGVVVDVSHADTPTLHEIVATARRPVIASHSGSRSRQDFPRFLTDDEARAVAGTGGVIGLWPYCRRGHGVTDLADLVAHARHLTDLVGAEHLCLGTDMNGVPGVMKGYRDERDLPTVTDALLDSGFGDDEVRGILGTNFLRVFEAVTCEP